MSDMPAAPNTPLRDDIVISVCFSDLPATQAAFKAVRELADRLDRTYRFREIILIVSDAEREAFLELVEQVSDLRLFVVRPGVGYYDRRVIAAEEAIGDIVFIANVEELPHLDVVSFLEFAEQSDAIVLATRAKHNPVRTGLSSPIVALGRISGFKANLNDLQSIAFPRTLLNLVLRHSEPQLALRFPPRDPRLPLAFVAVKSELNVRSSISDFPRRLQLLQKLLVYLAPTLLMLVTLTSTILTLLGVGYTFYTIGAWIFVETLAPGWLTTSAMLSMSATFMGLSMLGLSLGIQKLLSQQNRSMDERVSEEVNRIDLFGKVASDLNVEVESDTPTSLPRRGE